MTNERFSTPAARACRAAGRERCSASPSTSSRPKVSGMGGEQADMIAAAAAARAQVESVYRAESRRVFATLIRVLGGDFDLAEEALHEAFASALQQWPTDGVPDNPRA